jgi:hypothetical protein
MQCHINTMRYTQWFLSLFLYLSGSTCGSGSTSWSSSSAQAVAATCTECRPRFISFPTLDTKAHPPKCVLCVVCEGQLLAQGSGFKLGGLSRFTTRGTAVVDQASTTVFYKTVCLDLLHGDSETVAVVHALLMYCRADVLWTCFDREKNLVHTDDQSSTTREGIQGRRWSSAAAAGSGMMMRKWSFARRVATI